MRLPGKYFAPFLALLSASPSWAQDSASTRITLTIPDRVQFSAPQDIALGAGSDSDSMPTSSSLCVWSSTGSYTISGESEYAAAGRFRLNADASFLGYQVFWNDGSASRELKQGELLENLNTTNRSACTESGQFRPYLQVRIPEKQFREMATSAYYKDVLRLTISTN